MTERLSKILADLSIRAKDAEDAIAAASKEARDQIEARKEKARASATEAAEKVKKELHSIHDTAARNWNTVRAKIDADIDALKAGVTRAKHDKDDRDVESRAKRLDWEARVAVDYAVASIEQAKLAVLDAVACHAEAKKVKASGETASAS